jgi:hypothetical protein
MTIDQWAATRKATALINLDAMCEKCGGYKGQPGPGEMPNCQRDCESTVGYDDMLSPSGLRRDKLERMYGGPDL